MRIDHEQAALIRMIRPIYARDYAVATGWKRIKTKSSEYVLYENPNVEMVQLLIPQDPATSDYSDRILEVAEKLSQIEKRGLTAVLRNMLSPNSDCLHFKRVSEATKSGGIPLLDGVGFLTGIRRLLEAAACGVVAPQLFFKRLQRAEAKQFLNSCLLEQTGYGSYEINVTCTLEKMTDISTSQLELFPEIPFERQVTDYIVNVSGQIANSIENDAINEFVDRVGKANEKKEHQTVPLINANFCDAILDIHDVDDSGDLILSASWAPKFPHEKGLANSIRFRSEYVGKIEQISRQLKPSQKEHEPVNVIASVEALRGDMSQLGEREGIVDLLVFDKESDELIPASIRLSSEDYIKADQAHMQGIYVKVRGTLLRRRRKHIITDIQAFEHQK